MGVPSPSIQTQGVGHLLGHIQFFGKFFVIARTCLMRLPLRLPGSP